MFPKIEKKNIVNKYLSYDFTLPADTTNILSYLKECILLFCLCCQCFETGRIQLINLLTPFMQSFMKHNAFTVVFGPS